MWLLSDKLILLLYGEAFEEAVRVLKIHIMAKSFICLGVINLIWLVNEGKNKWSFVRTVTGCLCNIILNYVLILVYGYYGAAIATVITQFIAAYVMTFCNRRLYELAKAQTKGLLCIGILYGRNR